MLKIRLTRRGKKNSAFFRLVVAEHTAPIKGKFIEVLGFINPKTKEKGFKEDRVKYWIQKGAQCSDSAHNLLVKAGIIKGPKRAIKIKKKPVEPASAEASASPADKPAGKEEKKEEALTEKKEADTEKPSAESAVNEGDTKKGSKEAAEEKKPEENPEKKEEK
jgi:small subunit ribosomal protein S16